MSQAPAVVSDNQVKSKKPPLVPPEPQFWKRYSPHHEFPWSTLISVCIYVLVGLLIYALVMLAIKDNDDNKSLPVAMIGEPEGGGGNPLGVGTQNPGDLTTQPKEAVRDPASHATAEAPAPKAPDLEAVKAADPTLPEVLSGDRNANLDDSAAEAIMKMQSVSDNARRQLMKGLEEPPGHGKGGSGKGGGDGDGIGTKTGSGIGTGGSLDQRQRRVLRWKMQFNTFDGRDYLTQLSELGAILAMPEPKGGYRVIRDLRKIPATGEIEDLDTIKRIFWIDDKPDSVQSLARALRLPFPPPHFVAFFPESLEQELAEKEKKFHNREENQIEMTRFVVIRKGGKYQAVVESQEDRRGARR